MMDLQLDMSGISKQVLATVIGPIITDLQDVYQSVIELFYAAFPGLSVFTLYR